MEGAWQTEQVFGDASVAQWNNKLKDVLIVLEPHGCERLRKIIGQHGRKVHGLPGDRMLEGKPLGVQGLPLNAKRH